MQSDSIVYYQKEKRKKVHFVRIFPKAGFRNVFIKDNSYTICGFWGIYRKINTQKVTSKMTDKHTADACWHISVTVRSKMNLVK